MSSFVKSFIGQWSRHYEFCLKCETTERKHAGNGYCARCNMYRTETKIQILHTHIKLI